MSLKTRFDLLAQLGEHYLDRVGVGGSIPSQVIRKTPEISGVFACPDIFNHSVFSVPLNILANKKTFPTANAIENVNIMGLEGLEPPTNRL